MEMSSAAGTSHHRSMPPTSLTSRSGPAWLRHGDAVCGADGEARFRTLPVAEPPHGLSRGHEREPERCRRGFCRAMPQGGDKRPFTIVHGIIIIVSDRSLPRFPRMLASNGGKICSPPGSTQDFQYRQLEELATRYGEIVEFWIDIPMILSQAFRHQLYHRLAELQPEALILMNHGFERTASLPCGVANGRIHLRDLSASLSCPSRGHCGAPALVQLEREKVLPARGIRRHDDSSLVLGQGGPAETGRGIAGGCPVKQGRGCNHVLNVPPDVHGVIPAAQVKALKQLRKHLDAVGA